MQTFKRVEEAGGGIEVRSGPAAIVGRIVGAPGPDLAGTAPRVGCWMNVPYAQAPVGPLRFAAPRPLSPRGAAPVQVDARAALSIVAPQLPSRLQDVLGGFAGLQQEDCLRLHIWAPLAALEDGQPRPVLVWLHGGAWISGGAGLAWYDGSTWAREAGVVVVGVNYRLGALGWLAADAPENDNLGLQDSRMALQWIARHIGAFGGDPGRVTLMGQSAGGDNVGALMLDARPLPFQQAIVQSAPLGRELRTPDEARAVRRMVMRQWGVQDLAQLRRLPLPALLEGQAHASVMAQMKAEGIAGQVYTVVADGLLVPAPSREDYLRAAERMPSIVGATAEEMTAFPGMRRVPQDLAAGRRLFNAGAEQWQRRARAAGQKCWRYEFQYGPNPRYGACHCIELPFTFGTLAAFARAPMLAGGDAAPMQALALQWRRGLQGFVTGGDPLWPQDGEGLHRVGARPGADGQF